MDMHRKWVSNAWMLTALLVLLVGCVPAAGTVATPVEQQSPTAVPTRAQVPTMAPPEPQAIELEDGLGRQITLMEPASRVVSLAPSNTEILFAVGAGASVVGRDEFSDTPVEALELPSIGGGWGAINTELLLTLEADLVLAAEINTPEQVAELEALGLTVFMLPNPVAFDEVYANLITVGILTGHEEQARLLAESLRERVQALLARLEGVEALKTYYEVDSSDPDSPWTTGSGTFQDVLIGMAGGENIASALQGWGQISLEEIIAQDPQVMIFAQAPYIATTVESVAARTGWEEISAVANGRIHAIDTNWIDRPGSPRLVDALEALARMIHPERFE